MKHLLLTTIATLVLVGCGPLSQDIISSPIFGYFIIFIVVPILLYTVYYFKIGKEFSKANATGPPVKFIELMALKLRQIPSNIIIDARINAVDNGINISIGELATHFMAGGDINMVDKGLISAKKRIIYLSFEQAFKLDLQDKGLLEKR